MFRRPGLYLIVDAQRAERRSHHTVSGAHNDCRTEIVGEEMEKRHQYIQHQKRLGKDTQAKLLAEFHQQQVNRDVAHHVDRGQPGNLIRPGTKGTLQVDQIRRDQRVTQRTGQRDK